MKRKISEIIFREDLYPRFKPDQATIQRYANAIEFLPPILINQNSILIDGFHRLKAHQLAGYDEIGIEILKTASEKELRKLAYQYNCKHGLQLSADEKERFAQDNLADFGNFNDIVNDDFSVYAVFVLA